MNAAYAKTRAIQLKEKLNDPNFLKTNYERQRSKRDFDQKCVLMRVQGAKNGKKAHIFFDKGDSIISLCKRKDFQKRKKVPAWSNDKICKTCAEVYRLYWAKFVQPLPKLTGANYE